MIRSVKSTQISSSWSSSGCRSSAAHGGAARLVVAARVELEAVAPAESAVALGAEIGARLGEREVDVEDDRPQRRCHRARIACGRGGGGHRGRARQERSRRSASRDFRLLWGGQTISFVGDAAFVIAVGWRVTALTKSPGSLGFVLAAESVAMLATLLWGGVLADRYSRRLLMISSDLARAVVVAVFFVVEVTGHVNLTAVIILAACFGAADGFFQPAFGGIVPLVVETPMLPSASSWIGIARQGSAVLGPAIAGGLYGVAGPATVWAIEAVLVRGLRGRPLARPPAPGAAGAAARPAARARRRLPLRDLGAVDLDRHRRRDRDPDDRDGAVQRPAAAHRPLATTTAASARTRCSSA